MFPGAGATIYRNSDGEVTGWSYEGYADPPEPRDDEPYRSDEVIDIWLPVSADEFTAIIKAETAEGCSGVTLPGPLHWKTLRAIDRGASDVVIHTHGDQATWIGEVQDYDAERGVVVVELR